MPSNGSTTSIVKPDDYSAGPFKIDYISRWLQETSEPGVSYTYSDLSSEDQDIKVFYSIKPYQETGTEPYRPEVALVRAVCHVFVERLPERALPELAESMARIFEFYREAPKSEPSLPSPPRQLRAKVGRKYERPSFDLPEE